MRRIKKNHSKYGRYRFSRTQFILSVLLIAIGGVGTWIFYEALFTKSTDDWFESKAATGNLVSLSKDDSPSPGCNGAVVLQWPFKFRIR